MYRIKHISVALLILMFAMGGCKSTTPEASSDFTANEFILLLATSNNGEVGPCG